MAKYSIEYRKKITSIYCFKNRLSGLYYGEIRSSKESLSSWNKWCNMVRKARTPQEIDTIYNGISKYLSVQNEELKKHRLTEII